ncbi:hypothetical protein C9J12_05805 [Photobacterium frigidiphilum]|uniref:Uncharacterized protein n=1 Tax=Photobacterium frigidiphilum TaxID=264736 RepID=A0A2T3JMI2_9GAMM|nr:hypothetical protein [Photobacterium frigidiphilum]PSU50244.1 hypothetical protein C9J12_05805 [Photobacterium frigidiphilum]
MALKTAENIFLILLLFWSVGTFIWILLVFYLKSKWLPLLEDILDDGVRFYSLNFFLAGPGILQYATVFLWSFHAKRYGMLEKRDNVPKHIQKWFVFTFCWFMSSGTLMAASAIMVKAYDL